MNKKGHSNPTFEIVCNVPIANAQAIRRRRRPFVDLMAAGDGQGVYRSGLKRRWCALPTYGSGNAYCQSLSGDDAIKFEQGA